MKLQEMIAYSLSLDIDKIKPDVHLSDDLGADSIDLLELMMILEKRYDETIPAEDVENLNTPRKIADYLGIDLPL